MANHFVVATRWVARCTVDREAKPLKSPNLHDEGDSIYSYGHHFEVGRAIRDRKGEFLFFLLNGDRYGVTTARHQREVLSAVQRRGWKYVIIPFAVLEAAGIVKDSIRILEVTADHNEVKAHSSTGMPEGYHWGNWDEHGYIELTPEELQVLVDARNAKARESYDRDVARAEQATDPEKDDYWRDHWLPKNPNPPKPLTVDDLSERERQRWGITGTSRCILNNRTGEPAREMSFSEDTGTYHWVSRRHWLGESLISGDVRYAKPWKPGGAWDSKPRFRRTVKFLSGFDHNETQRSYFFCELPKCDASTVDEAYLALKPRSVLIAEEHGLNVPRQGDIFAIPMTVDTRYLRKEGAAFAKKGQLLGTNHQATETATMPDGTVYARGCLRHVPNFRAADHRRVTLGRGWHLIRKNTVPLQRAA